MLRQQQIAKNPVNYKKEQQETSEFEQKPIKNFHQFSDSEEREVKERRKKRLAERREKAEELKAKKQKIKTKENKIKKGEMWEKLNELNGQFKKIRDSKRKRRFQLPF